MAQFLGGTSPITKELVQQQQEHDRVLIQKRHHLQDLIAKTNDVKKSRQTLGAMNSNVISVLQHEAGITRRQDGLERYLQAFGAGPCIIVTLYDPKTKTAALTHMDALSDTKSSIFQMISRGFENTHGLEAHIIGGYEGLSSAPQLFNIIEALEEHQVRVVEVSVKNQSVREGDAVILDAETGEIFDMVGVPTLSSDQKRSLQRTTMQFSPSPIRILRQGSLKPRS